MDFFENYISKYFFLPIYFVIKIFREINLDYENYVKLVYYDDNTKDNKKQDLFFIMPIQSNSLNGINSDCRFFIKEYLSVNKNESNQTNETNKSNNDTKLPSIKYIVTLRKDNIYFRLLNLYNYNFIPDTLNDLLENTIFKNKISNYTIYKLNLKTKFIQIHLVPYKSYKKIKKIIFNNYIIVSNILALNSKHKEITWHDYNYDYDILFNKWIEPVEPSDTDIYKKLTFVKINEEKNYFR